MIDSNDFKNKIVKLFSITFPFMILLRLNLHSILHLHRIRFINFPLRVHLTFQPRRRQNPFNNPWHKDRYPRIRHPSQINTIIIPKLLKNLHYDLIVLFFLLRLSQSSRIYTTRLIIEQVFKDLSLDQLGQTWNSQNTFSDKSPDRNLIIHPETDFRTNGLQPIHIAVLFVVGVAFFYQLDEKKVK